MKVCLIGEFEGNLDEGMRKTSYYLANELRKHYQLLTIDVRDCFSKYFWNLIKRFEPDIIHYLHGPSLKSFALMKLISLYYKDAKTIISAIHPKIFPFFLKVIYILRPNLVLVQSVEMEKLFKRAGCEVYFLPSGVDIKKFKPVTVDRKKLREKYGISEKKFIILHVGSIKKGRNVQLLEKLQKEDNQVIIIGALSTGIEKKLLIRLRRAGCIVWPQYFKNIEEIYALSDCYIFPTPPSNKINSIEIPLSVLEAMACNLPVITTRFGALHRLFDEGDGLFYFDEEKEIYDIIKTIKKGVDIKTRNKVVAFSWEELGKKLKDIYGKVKK